MKVKENLGPITRQWTRRHFKHLAALISNKLPNEPICHIMELAFNQAFTKIPTPRIAQNKPIFRASGDPRQLRPKPIPSYSNLFNPY